MGFIMQNEKKAQVSIHPEMMLPDLLTSYPHVRPVLDNYGLHGCGGPLGPAESIRYFARAHGVDEQQLLHELEAAAEKPEAMQNQSEPIEPQQQLADVIYRRFFKGGIVVVLTAGAVWGAWLLLRIGMTGDFTAASIHEINAHGHAQIFGWVGLFVMGFAYQAFPRMKHTSLWRPDLANLTFYLMITGIFVRTIGEPLFQYPGFRAAAMIASGVEIFAIGLFVTIILKTLFNRGKPFEISDYYSVAALLFFAIQAVYEAGLLYALTAAANRTELLSLIATWQAPLRDIQIHGFAMLIILGVGLRMFPALFGFHAPGRKLSSYALVGLLLAIVCEVIGFLMMRSTDVKAWTGLWYGAVVLLAVTTIALTLRWNLFAKPQEHDRSTKYIKAAGSWLHVSMIMLAAVPIYMYVFLPNSPWLSSSGQEAVDMSFSHAYYGAIRHAITVGFISLTILGMAAKVVPTLKGVDLRNLSGLWLPFVLVNVGCAMRVGFQVMTDLWGQAYPIAGVSGILEVTGIAIWGVHLWRIMNRSEEVLAMRSSNAPITQDEMIASIVERYPETLPILLDKGFTPLENPMLRKTLARTVSLRAAARIKDLDPDDLVEELNEAAAGKTVASSN
jgi:heme/copper-type cytochrome/quinol oxidase subunit 4